MNSLVQWRCSCHRHRRREVGAPLTNGTRVLALVRHSQNRRRVYSIGQCNILPTNLIIGRCCTWLKWDDQDCPRHRSWRYGVDGRAGQSHSDIGRALGKHPASIHGVITANGGIVPMPRRRSRWALAWEEREEISRGIAAGKSIRIIAAAVERAPSTVSREIARNGGRQRVPSKRRRPSSLDARQPAEMLPTRIQSSFAARSWRTSYA